MTGQANFKGEADEAIHSAAQGLHRVGTADTPMARDFDDTCLAPSRIPAFTRGIGIDYSGAQTPESSLKGLRVDRADGATAAQELAPPPSPRKDWTRRGIAEWLADRLAEP